MNSGRVSSFITLFSSAGFVGIVLYLQSVQSGYNPVHQLMSELALGEQGQFMLGAFIMFAIAVTGAIGVISIFNASNFIKFLLGGASASFVGAGIFKLGETTTLHVALVGLAFVLLGLVMYLVPRYVEAFSSVQGRLVSWGLAVGTALAVALGNNVLPIGIGQRMAAACILLWLCWLAIFALRHKEVHGA
jgi:hypothetical protein